MANEFASESTAISVGIGRRLEIVVRSVDVANSSLDAHLKRYYGKFAHIAASHWRVDAMRAWYANVVN